MAEEFTFKVENGNVYAWNPDALDGWGLGEGGGGKWDWIGPLATSVGGGITAWLAAKTAAKYPVDQQGVRYESAPRGGGPLGGIDTTTLLLIGAGVLLFMSKPGKS